MGRVPHLHLPRILLAVPAFLLASGGAGTPVVEPLSAAFQQATAEAAAAEAQVQRLERAADQARDEAGKLRAQQAAAAEAIVAAEARISAADARLLIIARAIAGQRARLAEQQAPAGALLAGLATMASRPPMLAVLDSGSVEELVRVRVLLDATLPVIRQRTAALSAELEHGRRLQQSAKAARSTLHSGREALAARRREFAALESEALELAERRGSQALGAGDVALASGERAESLALEAERGRSAWAIASELAALPPPPPRPSAERATAPGPPIFYRLPALAPVVEGFGSVSASGVRARGVTLATARGAGIAAPAAGIVRFSGPFRSYDGILIIDHGDGWMSLVTNVSSPLRAGAKVALGQPLGRALGRVGVELSRNGRHVSPALIAGSSGMLSNGRKQG